ATARTTPTASEPTTSRLPHPTWLPRTRPQTSPNADAVTRTRPRTSSPLRGPKLSRIRVSTSGIVIRPIGTLTQKIHSQLMPSTSAPPTSAPLATDSPVIALTIPIAAPRRSGGNAALRSARPSGITSADPAPWTARATINASTLGASAAATDAAVNRPSPSANSLRRPYRSPTTAPVISSTAKLRLYALTTHSSCSTDAPRSRRILLSAVETANVSSAAINEPTPVSTTTHRVIAFVLRRVTTAAITTSTTRFQL